MSNTNAGVYTIVYKKTRNRKRNRVFKPQIIRNMLDNLPSEKLLNLLGFNRMHPEPSEWWELQLGKCHFKSTNISAKTFLFLRIDVYTKKIENMAIGFYTGNKTSMRTLNVHEISLSNHNITLLADRVTSLHKLALVTFENYIE